MSFTIKQQLVSRIHYPALRVEMPDEIAEVDVTYTAVAFNMNGDGTATAQFQVSIDGCFIKGSKDFYFTYSGEGNPLTTAEDALLSSLNEQAAS